MKLTEKQLELISAFIEAGKPFWLSVRRSFARAHSNTIDINDSGSRIALREIRPRRYDGPEDIQSRTKEVVGIIVNNIEDRCGSIFEGVKYLTEVQDGSSSEAG